MELFTQIDDAHAIIRLPKGVQKQVKLYKREDRVYVPHSGGYVEVRSIYNAREPLPLTTAHPDIKVVDYDSKQVRVRDRYLRFVGEGHK